MFLASVLELYRSTINKSGHLFCTKPFNSWSSCQKTTNTSNSSAEFAQRNLSLHTSRGESRVGFSDATSPADVCRPLKLICDVVVVASSQKTYRQYARGHYPRDPALSPTLLGIAPADITLHHPRDPLLSLHLLGIGHLPRDSALSLTPVRDRSL